MQTMTVHEENSSVLLSIKAAECHNATNHTHTSGHSTIQLAISFPNLYLCIKCRSEYNLMIFAEPSD